jgi:hypothetical protein
VAPVARTGRDDEAMEAYSMVLMPRTAKDLAHQSGRLHGGQPDYLHGE